MNEAECMQMDLKILCRSKKESAGVSGREGRIPNGSEANRCIAAGTTEGGSKDLDTQQIIHGRNFKEDTEMDT